MGGNMKRLLALFSCVLLFSALALAQISSSISTSISNGPDGMHGTMGFFTPEHVEAVVTGAPYSAENVSEHVQTLADGAHITSTPPGNESLPRFDGPYPHRTSRVPKAVAGTVLFGGPREKRNAHEGPIVVEINDPVAHVRYVFSLDEPIAHRQELPAERHPHTFARGQPGMIGGATSITTVASSPWCKSRRGMRTTLPIKHFIV